MYEYSASLLKIIDGDTVDVLIDLGFNTTRKERVRLLGIDSPESKTKDVAEQIPCPCVTVIRKSVHSPVVRQKKQKTSLDRHRIIAYYD